jgi:ATP-dependent Lhr-like helicase
VTPAEFLAFLACWQHVDSEYQVEGPHGVSQVLRQLAGFEVPAWAWESQVLASRVKDFRREWVDEVTLSGEFAWGRLWGSGEAGPAVRVTPIAFVAREELERWIAMTEAPTAEGLSGAAADLLKPLAAQGAMFPQNLQKAAGLVPAHFEMGLAELLARGLATCDSFAALRQMITPPSRRRVALRAVGRWSGFRGTGGGSRESGVGEEGAMMVARQLLARTGVVFRRTLARERIPVTWLALTRALRRMELRGEVRGGRFVAGFSGEQFALPAAVELLRRLKRQPARGVVSVSSADPLNFQGILTPDGPRVAATKREKVLVGRS